MCGICGYVSRQSIRVDELTEMNNTMIHRGPDDAGVEIYPMKDGYSIGLAQRRLSIMDLSALGHQPMHSADHRVSIVYNGEIYNFQEIRQELTDYPFRSSCDTEVIIAAYLKWGIHCVACLRSVCMTGRMTAYIWSGTVSVRNRFTMNFVMIIFILALN